MDENDSTGKVGYDGDDELTGTVLETMELRLELDQVLGMEV